MSSFDVDDFIAACAAAVGDADRLGAVRDVLERTGASRGAVAAAMGAPSKGDLAVLHHAPDLTILHVVWTPGMRIEPHDHQMTASIVVYEGSEANAFFRARDDGTIEARGGRVLDAGDVCQMGPETIHRVEADANRYTGALHVYAGDFFDRERLTWSEETGVRTDDPRPVAQLFSDAEAAWKQRSH